MAMDYYPLLCGAINSLESNTAVARRAVYDRARRTLANPLPSEGVTDPKVRDEQTALEDAIRRVEAEVQRGETPGAAIEASTDTTASDSDTEKRGRRRTQSGRRDTPTMAGRLISRIGIGIVVLAVIAVGYAIASGIIDLRPLLSRFELG